MKYYSRILLFILPIFSLWSCEEDTISEDGRDTSALLKFQFKFDSTQVRLDGFGQEVEVPEGHAAICPDFNSMSVHYIEFVPTETTMVGEGAVVYKGKSQTSQVSTQFDEAIVFDEAIQSDEGEVFLEVPLKDLPVGTYKYLRVSVTYQNADVKFNLLNLSDLSEFLPDGLYNQSGTLSSFIGFNTYIGSHQVKNYSVDVNTEKEQGFWMFESDLDFGDPYIQAAYESANPVPVVQGQAPAGATTVVNLLEQFGVTVPQGSCIVTGKLTEPLVITEETDEDKLVTLSFSVNDSFEWEEVIENGEWDIDATGQFEEPVVDMGLRGLMVEVQ
ncbi:hypothetical protein [Sediminitomix flava]|uniref:Uncharacterized protein n=1 Tax=Sediminitomix flava TaxID=379075 RepID=A0A315YVV2_SEDFL|nr:hypothetical protein [Sediminitomix flava]PWJ33668.1 hypothetical protein BC781_11215 [Sediminitomix flava]